MQDFSNRAFGEDFSPAALANPHAGGLVLGRVEQVADDQGMGRVEVSYPLHTAGDMAKTLVWAPVAQPFAGAGYGAFLLPGTGDVVVLGFLSNDPRSPVVLGSIWHGLAKTKEALAGSEVDRWVLVGKAGTRIAMVEAGDAMIEMTTPLGPKITISDAGGGTITLKTGGSTVTLTPSSMALKSASITIDSADLTITTGSCQVNAPLANFSSVIATQVAQATTVVATTYTTGAGNVL